MADRKPWVDRKDEDETQDAAEVAAERTQRSVKSKRKPGAITMGLTALGATPEILGTVAKDVATKAYRKAKGTDDKPDKGEARRKAFYENED